jgi:hypothetical protein
MIWIDFFLVVAIVRENRGLGGKHLRLHLVAPTDE